MLSCLQNKSIVLVEKNNVLKMYQNLFHTLVVYASLTLLEVYKTVLTCILLIQYLCSIEFIYAVAQLF